MKHFAAKGATEVDEAGKLIYGALLKVHNCTGAPQYKHFNYVLRVHIYYVM